MLIGAQSYLPGAEIPNYQWQRPNKRISIHEKTSSVDRMTPLSKILEPDMGHLDWAVCTECF